MSAKPHWGLAAGQPQVVEPLHGAAVTVQSSCVQQHQSHQPRRAKECVKRRSFQLSYASHPSSMLAGFLPRCRQPRTLVSSSVAAMLLCGRGKLNAMALAAQPNPTGPGARQRERISVSSNQGMRILNTTHRNTFKPSRPRTRALQRALMPGPWQTGLSGGHEQPPAPHTSASPHTPPCNARAASNQQTNWHFGGSCARTSAAPPTSKRC